MSSAKLQELASVTFNHAYYTSTNGACVDIQWVPTPDSHRLILQHGLRIRQLAKELKVYYQPNPASELSPPGVWKPWDGTLRLTFAMELLNPRLLRVTEDDVPNVRQKEIWRIADGDEWTVYSGKPGAFRYTFEHATAVKGTVAVTDEDGNDVGEFSATRIGERADETAFILEADIDLQDEAPGLYTFTAKTLTGTVQEESFYVVPQAGSRLPMGVLEMDLTLDDDGDERVPPGTLLSMELERDTASVPWRYQVTLSRDFDKYDLMRVKDSSTADASTDLANGGSPPPADTTTIGEYPATWLLLTDDSLALEEGTTLEFVSVATEADLTASPPTLSNYKIYQSPNDRLQLEGRIAGGTPGNYIWEILYDKLPNPSVERASLDINITL